MPQLSIAEALRSTPITARHFQRGVSRAQNKPEWFGLGDVLAAPFRGAEGAIQGVYGLADTVLLDVLPDWNARFLGSSRTVAGGLVEGVTQFAAGFVPLFGAAGKVGALAKATTGSKIARTAAAGAAADLAVFTGHEERLSNLISEFPALRNPITDYLAADPADSEAEGRFKNVLEGLGVGTFVDALVLGVRSMRAATRAQASGQGPKAVFRAAREAASPEAIDEALGRGSRTPIDPEDPRLLGEPHKIPAKPAGRERIIKDLYADDEAVRYMDEATREAQRRGLAEGVNPRNLTVDELFERGITRFSLNLERFQSEPQGPLQLMRTYEAFIEEFGKKDLASLNPTALEVIDARATTDLLDMANAHESRDSMLRALREDVETSAELVSRKQAWRRAFLDVSTEATRSMREALEAPPEVAAVRFARAKEDLEFLYDMEALIKGMGSESGRDLRAYQIPVRSMEKVLREEGSAIFKRVMDADTKGLTDQLGGVEHLRKQFQKMLDLYGEGGVDGASRLAGTKAGFDSQVGWHMANSLALSTWLSSPRTWVVNAIGPLYTSVMRTQERVLGGLMRADREAVRSGVRQAIELWRNAKDALDIARKDFRTGRQTLLPQNTRLELQRAKRLTEAKAILDAERAGTREPTIWHPSSLGVEPQSFGGQMLRGMDYVVGFPQRVMGSTDSLVKQINYRALTRERLHREGAAKGLTGDALAAHIESRSAILTAQGQAYTLNRIKREGMESARSLGLTGQEAGKHVRDYVLSKKAEIEELTPIADEAIGRALEVSATADLERGTLSHWIQQGTVQHPYLRLVLPFVRTPAQLLVYARRRLDVVGPAAFLLAKKYPAMMPLVQRSKNAFLKDMLSADPMRKADAIGRVTMGTGIAAFFFGLAAAGKVTGKGPSEPNRQRALTDAGVQPYSIRVGDGYVSYTRLDPYATLIGIAADLIEYSQWADTAQQSTAETLAASFVTAMLNPLKERSYLRGLANTLDLINDPERRSQRFFEQFVGSLTPPGVSAFGASFLTAAGDEHMREVRGVLDAMANRVPGISATLEPRRNVFGEPISRIRSVGGEETGGFTDIWLPIAYAEVTDEIVHRELALLRHGFSVPQTTRGGVELIDYRSARGQTAFDRYQELHGQVLVGGRTIKETLRSVVTSLTYQALPVDSDTGLESPRVAIVENVIRQYRDRAFAQMLREYPEVVARYREIGQLRRQRALGRPTPEVEIGVPGLMQGRLPALVAGSNTLNRERF